LLREEEQNNNNQPKIGEKYQNSQIKKIKNKTG
jgi:hypothetical protein